MEETQAFDDSQDSSSAARKPLESVSVEGVNGRGGRGRNNRDYGRDHGYDYDNDHDYDRDHGYDHDNDRSDRDTYRRGYTGPDGRDRVSYISTFGLFCFAVHVGIITLSVNCLIPVFF